MGRAQAEDPETEAPANEAALDDGAQAVPALPEQHDFYKMPAKFGHVPVAEEPLGWDRRRRFEHLYPRVRLPTQVVERFEFGSPQLEPNRLYFGDNLHVMRSLPSESIDLIYIDPPFFSQRNYNVLFGDQNELRSFQDIWEGGLNGYVVWLNARLYEMKRLLKPSGSLFVHLDWHAGHYVKVELDKLFGYENFQNEIIWYYSGGGASKKRFARKHDNILFYSRNVGRHKFNVDDVRVPYKWTAGQKRADGSERDLERGKLPDDVLEMHGIMPWAKGVDRLPDPETRAAPREVHSWGLRCGRRSGRFLLRWWYHARGRRKTRPPLDRERHLTCGCEHHRRSSRQAR